MSDASVILSLPALWFLACAPGYPDPTISSIDPRAGYNGEDTEVVLRGTNFYPAVELDVFDRGARLDRQFAIDLYGDEGEFALGGVEAVSYEELVAYVPEGLPVGQYGVRLTTPSGAHARLPHGFRVTDTRADHLDFDLEDVVHDVNEPFTVGFDLYDPAGLVVFQSLDVRLSVVAEDGSATLEVDPEGLAGPTVEVQEEGLQVVGTLRPSGHGYVSLLSASPETLDLTLEPVDPESIVTGASALLEVTAGQLHGVRIDLPGPQDPFVATAGETFDVDLALVDVWGNVLSDADATLALYERCGGFSTAVEFTGQTTVNLAITTATDDTCAENSLVAAGTTSGESEPFQVLPGPATAYDVTVFPSRVVAGTEVLYVHIEAWDDWGNIVPDYGEDWEETTGQPLGVTLYDDLGGLDPDVGYGSQSCPGFEGGRQICEAFLWTAGTANRLLAVGEDGLRGKSPEFDVRTGPLAQILLDLATGPYVAGTSFDVEVLPGDAFLNAIAVDPSAVAFEFTGSPGEVACAWDGALPADGRRTFACTATLATESQEIAVAIPSLSPDVRATSDEFQVDNGALAAVEFDVAAGTEWVAGSSYAFGLQGYDAWGNPYVVQSDPVVQIADDTGSLSAGDVTLDAAGAGTGTGTITVATPEDHLTATQYGIVLGSSSALAVLPASLDSVLVEPARGWTFVGEALEVDVTAVDAWGNAVTDFAETVLLTALGGSAEDAVIDGFVDGVGSATLVATTPVVGETLYAEALTSEVTGAFSPLDVLEADCGVEAALAIDGVAETVICSSGGSASADVDGGSSTGASLYRFSDGAELDERGTASSVRVTWDGDGPRRVTLVAFDAAGCGDEAEALVWIGPPDGSPVGPVIVTPADAERMVGSTTSGTTLVDVQAFDCALDVASFGALLARTDLGSLTSGLVSTGQGLELTLNAAGHGQFSWSVASDLRGGTSTVFVGRDGAIALGIATIEAIGDDALPVVLEVDPVGAAVGTADTFTVRFDEPMRAASLTTSTVTFNDSVGALTIDSCTLDDAETGIEIALAMPVDLAADVYTLALSSQIRDVAGNRLDGGWSGSAADFSVTLGAVTDSAPAVLTCTADTPVLRPDGDHVASTNEADEVVVQVTADGVPSWWRMVVSDEDGTECLTRWSPAAGGSDTLTWDGRDQAGSVLPNGIFLLEFEAADTSLDLGTGCEVEVTLDNALEELP